MASVTNISYACSAGGPPPLPLLPRHPDPRRTPSPSLSPPPADAPSPSIALHFQSGKDLLILIPGKSSLYSRCRDLVRR